MFNWLQCLINVRNNLIIEHVRSKSAEVQSVTDEGIQRKLQRQATDPTGMRQARTYKLASLKANSLNMEANQSTLPPRPHKSSLKESQTLIGNCETMESPKALEVEKMEAPNPSRSGVTFAEVVSTEESGEGEAEEGSDNSPDDDDNAETPQDNVIHLHPEQVSSRIIMEGYLFKRRYKPKV
jgi:hypothetical protein